MKRRSFTIDDHEETRARRDRRRKRDNGYFKDYGMLRLSAGASVGFH